MLCDLCVIQECAIACCSTFQQELEKCADQPQKIGGVFIRYVSFLAQLASDISQLSLVYTSVKDKQR